jgi:hypothetical protein
MLYRALAFACAAVALALLASGSAVQAGKDKDKDGVKTYDVKIKTVEAHKLTVTGKDGKDYTKTVAKDAKISCDGKDCKLSDLKAGLSAMVTVSADEITVVAATTKAAPKDGKDKADK